jgi:branched-chain amino acid transport system permease protein
MNVGFVFEIALSVCISGSIYLLLSIGPSLLFKVQGIFNFAHGSLVTLFGFLFYYFYEVYHFPLWVIVPALLLIISLLTVCVLETGIRPFLSASPLLIFVATLSLGIMLEAGMSIVFGTEVRIPEPSYKGYTLGSLYITLEQAVMIIGALLFTFVYIYWLSQSGMGRKLRAYTDNAEALQMLGVASEYILFLTLLISLLTACFAGIAMSYEIGLDPLMGSAFTFKSYCIVILVNQGGILLLGATSVFIAALENILIYFGSLLGLTSGYKDMASFILLALVLLYKKRNALIN